MGKVVNSVQQICSACDELLKPVKDCEYMDVIKLADTLKKEKSDLLTMFMRDPGATVELDRKKAIVESLALRLEFYLAMRLGLYKDRYDLREESKIVYEFCRQVTFDTADVKEIDNLLSWSAYTRWALKFYARSLHIIFECDERDKLNLNTIRHLMDTERKGL